MGVYRALKGHSLSIAVKITRLIYFHFDNILHQRLLLIFYAISEDLTEYAGGYPIRILFHPAALAAAISSRGSSPTRRS